MADASSALRERLRRITKRLRDPKQLNAIGKMSVIVIKRRTRQGFGVRQGIRERLKPLSQSYIEKRRRMRLSGKTSPAKSNLTLTGDMIDSLFHRVDGFTVIVEIASSQEVKAGYVQDERPFLGLTDQEINMIRDHILTGVRS